MKSFFLSLSFFILLGSCAHSQKIQPTDTEKVSNAKTDFGEHFNGFFNFWWNEKGGNIILQVDQLDSEFLYVNALTAGVGSNDIGLDRGQLGNTRVVKFIRTGNKLLLIEPNLDFRAESDNPDEKRSVEEAFASSVIWGFKIINEEAGKIYIDITSFLLRDAHGVVNSLKSTSQGQYKLDLSRSAIYKPACLNFPKNSEFENILTFTGDAKGSYVDDVVPSPDAITVRQHHSFIELPDANYKRRKFDPRSGFMAIQYKDYASPIDQPLVKRFIQRHRLEKKNPAATISEAKEPIIYYVDRGAPEPIRSALIDGARWWNQAFEAAGYQNAFQVEVLPEGVHPLDIRYNVIQWVHRSTRGWSYGGSVTDPRTGEIIKGHVSLGSLRVRQDFLIAQGLIKSFEDGKVPSSKMQEMALARLRQLSAHEVGHTIGLMHNFAASTNGRASVMDYPHPYLELNADGSINFDKAYDDKIGTWDKQAVKYGYQDFVAGVDEDKALDEICQETIKMGLRYISDRDARPFGGAHPFAHLWDNGENAVSELSRLLSLREVALQNFGEDNLRPGEPMAALEEVLVPLYLMHRYQIEAVAKLIGGVEYNYALKGDDQKMHTPVLGTIQEKAIAAMLRSIHPEVLDIPDHILKLIPPKPPGYYRDRESFTSRTGPTFDPLAAAEAAATVPLQLLLHPQRAARMIEQKANGKNTPGLKYLIDQLILHTWKVSKGNGRQAEIGMIVDQLLLKQLFLLASNQNTLPQVRAIAFVELTTLEDWLELKLKDNLSYSLKAHYLMGLNEIKNYKSNPKAYQGQKTIKLPDGSPIGTDKQCSFGH